MISPYLRRPLRSLDEMMTQADDTTPAAKKRVLREQIPGLKPARAVDPASADNEKSIASNR